MPPIKMMSQSYLSCLQDIFPVKGVVIVGAGNGCGQWVKLLNELAIASAILIEADSFSYRQLQAAHQNNPGWQVINQVVAEVDEEVTFHVVANRAESSLLPPELLRELWPNIKKTDEFSNKATTLKTLCTENTFKANYLIVDCLPSLKILRSASHLLADFDVIIPRMVLNQAVLSGADAGQHEIDTFLQEKNYRCIKVEQERHSDLGHGLFVRDYSHLAQEKQKNIAQLKRQRDEQVKLATDRQAEIERLKKASAELERLDKERQQLIGQLSTQRDEQVKLATERQAEIERLKKASAELERLDKERQQLIGQLSTQRDEQVKLATERQAEIERLKKARAELERLDKERQQLIGQLSTQRDEQVKLATERQAEIVRLKKVHEDQERLTKDCKAQIEGFKAKLEQKENALMKAEDQSVHLAQRQSLIDEELVKAEAQLELIKDVLLRKKEF